MRTVVSERSCARARRALSLVLDHEADAADVEALAIHLGRCGSCREYSADVSAFTRDLRSTAAEHRYLLIAHMTGKENGNG